MSSGVGEGGLGSLACVLSAGFRLPGFLLAGSSAPRSVRRRVSRSRAPAASASPIAAPFWGWRTMGFRAPRPWTASLARHRGAAKPRAGREKMPRPRFARRTRVIKGRAVHDRRFRSGRYRGGSWRFTIRDHGRETPRIGQDSGHDQPPGPAPGGGVRECGQAPACPHGVPTGRKRLTVKGRVAPATRSFPDRPHPPTTPPPRARSRKDAQRPLP